ncbi:MAG TPA: LysR family transcriptional regulator ArgP [Solirubrobacterales bacterium]|nr:LysR family transcriptional regulator ArgP [Solirubrobacterales bacterium]
MMFSAEHLQTLVVLIEEGTFEAAARQLRLTPSAVSQRIKTMEQTSGQILVQRTNPVLTTTAGDIALRYGRQLMLLEDETVKALEGSRHDGDAVTVPIAVNADSLATWFLEAVAEMAESSEVVFDIHREDQEHTTSLLRSGKVMAAVTSIPDAVQGCRSERLGVMRYRAVCSPSYAERWLGGEASFAKLDQAPMVNFDRKDELQNRYFRGLTGRRPTAPRHFVPTSTDYGRAIKLGLGWGLLPEEQCDAEVADGSLLELAQDDPVDVPLHWQRWSLSSPLLDELSAAVKDTAGRHLHP